MMPGKPLSNDTTMTMSTGFPSINTCHEADAPTSAIEKTVCSTSTVPYTTGIPGTPRPTSPGENSGIMTLIAISFLLVAIGFKHCSRLFRTFTQDLWSVRRRANVFDDRTANETQVLVTLIIQTCVYESILLLALTGRHAPVTDGNAFTATMLLLGVTSSLYLFQLAAYGIIGYVFSDRTGRSQWIKGFNASQALLGFALIIPALLTIFYPASADTMLIIGAALYITARIVFICKGFRIFYHKITSLLYFILYLCSVEIIPVITAYSGVILISRLITE